MFDDVLKETYSLKTKKQVELAKEEIKNSILERYSNAMSLGKMLDVTRITYKGTGVAYISIPKTPRTKIYVDPLLISSSSKNAYLFVLCMIYDDNNVIEKFYSTYKKLYNKNLRKKKGDSNKELKQKKEELAKNQVIEKIKSVKGRLLLSPKKSLYQEKDVRGNRGGTVRQTSISRKKYTPARSVRKPLTLRTVSATKHNNGDVVEVKKSPLNKSGKMALAKETFGSTRVPPSPRRVNTLKTIRNTGKISPKL